jgi:predicted dehydrogenase
MEQLNITRKKFLSTTAILSAGMLAKPLVSLGRPNVEDIRLGIIGTGNRGGGIAQALTKIQGFTITACCDTLENNLEKTMQFAAPGAKSYKDYRSLLEDRNVDAVLIATPLNQHFPMAMDAIEAGKHIYLEKTMTYSIDEALRLENKMKANRKLVLQVGYQNRYFPMFHRAKQVIKDNWLGKIMQVECQYHRNSSWRVPVPHPSLERQLNWRMYKEYSGGLMAELCAHQIDIVNWMMEAHPTKVIGMGDINYWKDGRETYDNVRCVFHYPNGMKLSSSSILSNAYRGFSMRLLGDKATLEIYRDKAFLFSETLPKEIAVVDGVTGATKSNAPGDNGVPLEFEYPGSKALDPTLSALLSFADCIRNGTYPASNVVSGKQSAICVHMANKTMETGKPEYWQGKYVS